MINMMSRMNGMNLPKYKKNKKYRNFPNNWSCMNGIYINPNDKRKYPYPITSINPDEFEYTSDGINNHFWGIVDEDAGSLASTILSITNSITYHNDSLTLYNEFASPLDQFVKVLTKKKLAKIDQSPIRDVMNRIIVELPASTSLAILHDKIISAVVGWCRGYHGYVFIDSNDGAVLGPAKNDGYIDMMHSKFKYHSVGDDRKFPLASLIKAVGEICEYVYDLGDQFRHKIELIEIKDETYRPVRNVTILDGKTSCPPEDSNGLSKNNGGNYDFNDLLKKYVSNPSSCAKQIRKIESSAVNYTSHWLTGQPIKFEALKYDVAFHQHVLDRMIEGPNVTLRNIGEFVETYHACNYCGESLKSLQKCSACNMTYYCSKDCQKKDWVDGHKEECKELKAFSS